MCGVGADDGSGPLKQIHTTLQAQHLRRTLEEDIKVTALFKIETAKNESSERSSNMSKSRHHEGHESAD